MASTAKVQLRKETEWMRRQPKARSTKAKFRQDAYHDLVALSRSGPKQDTKADFGAGGMTRQVCNAHLLSAYCMDENYATLNISKSGSMTVEHGAPESRLRYHTHI